MQNSVDNHFFKLFEKVSQIVLELPQPKLPVSLFRTENTQMDSASENDEMSSESSDEKSTKEIKSHTISTDVYVYRSSRSERAFVPPNASQEPSIATRPWGDYIALDDIGNITMDKVDTSIFRCRKMSSDSTSNSNKAMYTTSDRVLGETSQEKSKKHLSERRKVNTTYMPLKVKRLRGSSVRTKATKAPKKRKKKK